MPSGDVGGFSSSLQDWLQTPALNQGIKWRTDENHLGIKLELGLGWNHWLGAMRVDPKRRTAKPVQGGVKQRDQGAKGQGVVSLVFIIP